MSTAVVIGAGASGLASAFFIQKFLPNFSKVIVLESSKRVGGWVNSTRHPDGCIFEHGPRSLRPVGEQGRNTLQLVEELGLAKDILPVFRSDASAKNRYLYVKEQLCPLPNSLSGLFKTLPPFSKPLIKSVALEPIRRRGKGNDESVHSFVQRRLGREMADIAIDAMVRGIFAGDCRKLSAQACFPPLYKMEQDYGSLFAGAIFGSKGPKPELTGLARKAKQEGWASWSLAGGMQELTDSLADAVGNSKGGEVRLGSPCVTLTPSSDGLGKIAVQTDSDKINADLVVSAIYSKDLASLLPGSMGDLRQDLSLLPSVNVVVVNLEYKENVLPVKGFGHLLPSSENKQILGIVYDSCTFPEHNRKGSPESTRITVMMGGAWYKNLLNRDGVLPEGSELVWMAKDAAAKQLGIRSHPIRWQVSLQKECIPQYQLGHVAWVQSLEKKIQESNLPLHLVGASYRGPAVNDCINNARKMVASLAQRS
ncbi:protoporphyrinogen oxidase [Elysia marginata]|uniref:Protoporphyrinogen oxidase n=1 Tax=Elysia marginata TaxID=1093978 RepID=A0AAV4IJY3_9GAST|nr:protoporphyrinogen oxidase [Elysia marginata]